MNTLLNCGMLGVLLSALAPALYFISRNHSFFPLRGHILGMAGVFALGIVVALACQLFSYIIQYIASSWYLPRSSTITAGQTAQPEQSSYFHELAGKVIFWTAAILWAGLFSMIASWEGLSNRFMLASAILVSIATSIYIINIKTDTLTSFIRRSAATITPCTSPEYRQKIAKILKSVVFSTAMVSMTMGLSRYMWVHMLGNNYNNYPLLITIWLIAVAFTSFIAYTIGFRFINVLLAVFIVMSMAVLTKHELDERKTLPFVPPPENIPLTFTLKKKPNIYYIHFESFHSREVINKYYNFDIPELFEYLDKAEFSVYKDFYTNYIDSLNSLISLFSMTHHYYRFNYNDLDIQRSAFSLLGNNNIFKILKHNGYSLNAVLYNNYLFRDYLGMFDYSNQPYRTSSRDFISVLFSTLCRYKPLKKKVLDTWAHFFGKKEIRMTFEEFLERYPDTYIKKNHPAFFFLYFGANHIHELNDFYPGPGPDFGGVENWLAVYRNYVGYGLKYLYDFLDAIIKHDPEALIVIAGDHGSYKYGRDLGLKQHPEYLNGTANINDMFREYGLEPIDISRNTIEVLLAIRWPKSITPQKIPAKGLGHINLFPFLFYNINEEKYSETSFSPNISMHLMRESDNFLVLAKDGILLENWQLNQLVDNRLVDKDLIIKQLKQHKSDYRVNWI